MARSYTQADKDLIVTSFLQGGSAGTNTYGGDLGLTGEDLRLATHGGPTKRNTENLYSQIPQEFLDHANQWQGGTSSDFMNYAGGLVPKMNSNGKPVWMTPEQYAADKAQKSSGSSQGIKSTTISTPDGETAEYEIGSKAYKDALARGGMAGNIPPQSPVLKNPQALNQASPTASGRTANAGVSDSAPGAQSYTVQSGDSLSKIAARLGVPVSQISGYRSGNPNLIYPGEVLSVGGMGGGQQGQTPAPGIGNSGSLGETLQSLKGTVDSLVEKGYGDTDVKDMPQDVDLKNIKAKGNQNTNQTDAAPNDLASTLEKFGLNIGKQSSLTDIVKELTTLYGLDDTKGEIQDLDNQYADDVALINDDPWITEGLRVKKVAKLEDKYDMKRSALMDRLSLNGDVIGKAISLFNAEKSDQQQLLLKTLDYQMDQMKEANKADDVETQTVQLSDGTDLLINRKTGETIRTLGGAKPTDNTSSSSVIPKATKPLTNAQINTGVGNASLSLEQFKNYDLTTQTYFANNKNDIERSKSDIESALDEGQTLHEVLETINSNTTYPSGIRKYYVDYANTYAKDNGKGGTGTWGNPFSGSSNPVTNFFKNLF